MIMNNLCNIDNNDMLTNKLYKSILKEYIRVSDGIKILELEYEDWLESAILHDADYYRIKSHREYRIDKAHARQARLCSELYSLSLSIEDKIWLWENNRDMLPPYDGMGKDEYCGRILPTQLEVDIGMYTERALYEFTPFTCGVYAFYTPDMKNIFIGSSQYIEKYLHSMANRMIKPNHNKKRFKNLYNIMFTPGVIFKILDRCPYSILGYVEYKYKEKYYIDNPEIWNKLTKKERNIYARIR